MKIWVIRVLTCGIAFVGCALLVGRITEGIVPGWGGPALVTFALGTLMSSLVGDTFEEVPTAALGFAAFALAWSRRPFASGLLAGVAALTAYQAGLTAAIIGLYIALGGARLAGRFLLGLAPSILLLGAYNWAAFGSPLHLSYRYNASEFRTEQGKGFFGIHEPGLHATRIVLVGDRGLLVDAPVLALAAIGLVLLWRRGFPAESAACALVTLAYLAVEFGYFDPYGGDSPGPRFFIPALPFLALGLGLAFERWRIVTTVVALLSIVPSTVVGLTWQQAVDSTRNIGYTGTVWRQMFSYVQQGHAAKITTWAPRNLLHWIGVKDTVSGSLVVALGIGSLAVALYDGWSTRGHERLKRLGLSDGLDGDKCRGG